MPKIELGMIELHLGDCLEKMMDIPDGIVDLTVTSPPYDNLRTYNGSLDWGEHVWKPVLEELFRVTKHGGVVVWVVGDATIKGSETGTSFKQALWAMECGFRLHDTMIWNKAGFTAVGSLQIRYAPVFEYMFIFSKGKPKSFNPIIDRENKNNKGMFSKNKRLQNGEIGDKMKSAKRRKHGQRFNIWKIYPTDRSEHPAIFPEQLANDHILSWSNEGDTVLDPFMGSGTTGKMSLLNNRNFIGIELDPEYFKIAGKRINEIGWKDYAKD